jgi:hypothetical protein
VLAGRCWPSRARGRTERAAYRANNLGVARLEQYDFAGAEASFRRALDAGAVARDGAAQSRHRALLRGQAQRASAELTRARTGLPAQPQADYVLGLIARAANRPERHGRRFDRAPTLDPTDPGIAVNLGQLDLEARRYPDAIAELPDGHAAEPYNATAAYGLATALLRSGAADEGQTAMTRFERLRDSPFAVTYSAAYLEQGRYAQAIASTGAEAGSSNPHPPQCASRPCRTNRPGPRRPSRAPDSSRSSTSTATATSTCMTSPAGCDLLRIECRPVTDVSASALTAPPADASRSSAADADNDGDVDLLVLRRDAVSLWRQTAPWRFADAGAAAGLAIPGLRPRTAAWLDADHDGDLDLVVAGEGTPAVRVFQNRGDGTFTDITAATKIEAASPVVALIPTDFDERRDIDLFVLSATGGPRLFRNLREAASKTSRARRA